MCQVLRRPAVGTLLWTGLVTLALLTAGCDGTSGAGVSGPGDQGAGRTTGRPASAHLVTTVSVQRAALSSTQERPGSLRHRKLVRIVSQEEGRITELALFEGDRVTQGQTLVRLEDDLLQAELSKAKATRDQKELDLQRLEDLRRKRSASEDEVAQAATALALALADLRVLELRLAFTQIRAHFAGVITERLVEPGDVVTRNTHLLSLADPESLVAEVFASELLLPQLRVGDQATVRIDALGDQQHPARILRIHPQVDDANRQGIVELALTPLPAGAQAGQFVRARLSTRVEERLLVPFRALQRDREGEFVWLLGPESTAERRRVQSGRRTADGVEILAGLAPGDQVITRGFLGMAQGKSVKVVAG